MSEKDKPKEQQVVEILLSKDDTKVLVDALLNPPEISGRLKEAAEKYRQTLGDEEWLRKMADAEGEIVGGLTAGNMEKPMKAILFDLDGTLVEARDIHREALNDALAEHGFTITLDEHYAEYNGLPTKVKLAKLTEKKGLPEHLHPWVSRRKQRFTLRRIDSDIHLDEEKVALFQSLRQRGVKTAVCSNAVAETVVSLLRQIGVLELVDVWVSNENVKNAKPDPEMFLKAAEQLGVDISECVIVEDSPIGEVAARAAHPGMIVMVDGPHDIRRDTF